MLTRWPLRLAAAIVGVALLGMVFGLSTEHRTTSTAPPRATAPHSGIKPAGALHVPEGTTSNALPLPAQLAVSRGLGADERAYWVRSSHGVATADNHRERVSARFSASGAQLSAAGGNVGLVLDSFGHPGAATSVGTARVQTARNRVTYGYGDVSQWWSNGPLGFEQGLTVGHAPAAGSGPLTFGFSVSGSLHARLTGHTVQFVDAAGRVVLRYGDLSATDARGRTLPSSLSVRGDRLFLKVNAAGARYPIGADPLVQAAQLTATDGAVSDSFGQSVAVSANGSTVAIGANGATIGANASQGAVYVFTAPASGWAHATQVAKLTASDGAADDGLGSAVAISADGTTIAAGAPLATNGTTTAGASSGRVYVFTEPSGGWGAPESAPAELTESKLFADALLGTSVAFSGTSVVAGAPIANSFAGQVDVFNRPSSGTWASETASAVLTAGDAGGSAIGDAVAATSNTIVAGAAAANSGEGDAFVFTTSGAWATTSTETATLTPSDGAVGDGVGSAVAISGSTIVVGAPSHNSNGAVYVFVVPSGGYATGATPSETAELTASNGASGDALGSSVATNGSTIFAGAPAAAVGSNAGQGAVYEFDEPSTGWANGSSSSELNAAGGAAGSAFGFSLSMAGNVVLAGANAAAVNGNANQGAGYVFEQPPTVTAISPSAGSTAGGTSVSITGTGFASGDSVSFGGVAATSVTVNSATSITAVAPAGSAGTVAVTVTDPSAGPSATSSADQFTYVPAPTVTAISPAQGATAGGTSVTITGTNFLSGDSVKFGSTVASSVTVSSATSSCRKALMVRLDQ